MTKQRSSKWREFFKLLFKKKSPESPTIDLLVFGLPCSIESAAHCLCTSWYVVLPLKWWRMVWCVAPVKCTHTHIQFHLDDGIENVVGFLLEVSIRYLWHWSFSRNILMFVFNFHGNKRFRSRSPFWASSVLLRKMLSVSIFSFLLYVLWIKANFCKHTHAPRLSERSIFLIKNFLAVNFSIE